MKSGLRSLMPTKYDRSWPELETLKKADRLAEARLNKPAAQH